MLSRDAEIHLRALAGQPAIEDSVSHCVECGFCEPVCPSRDLTLTPRQRIVVRREMARQEEHSPVLESLLADFEYDGIETCAADGACRLACPVGIDTGEFIRELRAAERGEGGAAHRRRRSPLVAGMSNSRRAQRWSTRARAGRRAERLRRAGGAGAGARWSPDVPPARALPVTRRKGRRRRLSAGVREPDVRLRRRTLRPVAAGGARGGIRARGRSRSWIPEDVDGVCCATPFSSKGYARRARHGTSARASAIGALERGGRLPVVIDASSCALGLRDVAADSGITVFDSIDWVHDRVLDRLVLDEPVASRGAARQLRRRAPRARAEARRDRGPPRTRSDADHARRRAAGWPGIAACFTPS